MGLQVFVRSYSAPYWESEWHSVSVEKVAQHFCQNLNYRIVNPNSLAAKKDKIKRDIIRVESCSWSRLTAQTLDLNNVRQIVGLNFVIGCNLDEVGRDVVETGSSFDKLVHGIPENDRCFVDMDRSFVESHNCFAGCLHQSQTVPLLYLFAAKSHEF